MKRSGVVQARLPMALRERMELLRARGAAERLAIRLAQLDVQQRLHGLHRGVGWGVSVLRMVLRARGGAAALGGAAGWWRFGAWALPWLLYALRRGKRHRGAPPETASWGDGDGVAGAALGLALLRLARRALRRRTQRKQAAADDA